MSGLLLEAVFLQMERCTLRHDALRLIVAALKAQRGTLDVPGDALTALAGLEDNWRAEANKAPSARQKVYLDLLSLTAQWHGELSGSTPFSALKACYQRSVADLQAEVAETQKKLGNLLRFLQEAFGKGTELSMGGKRSDRSPRSHRISGAVSQHRLLCSQPGSAAAPAVGTAAAPDRSDRTGVKWNCCNLK